MTAVESTVNLTESPPLAGRAPVDILIPTFNESVNVPYAIASVIGWASRVFVLDSGSTDRTAEIARELGAEVVEHPWEGYARQKNWALENLPFQSPWVFILDADESITPALRDEVIRITSQPAEQVRESGFYVNRYLVFMGKRIRHCGYFPSWNLRLFKRGAARYEERPVHEHMILQGKEGYLKGLMAHEDRRGLEWYIGKHNRYSTLEAETIFYGQRNGRAMKASPFGNAVERRRFFKNKIYPRLPVKWLGRFVWMYFIRLGILDGMAGLRFCLLISSHELFTTLKLRELQQAAQRERRAAILHGGQLTSAPGMRISPLRYVPSPVAISNSGDSSPPPETSGTFVATSNGPALSTDEVKAQRTRSPWSLREKIQRVLWMMVQSTLFRPSFHNWYRWRNLLLRCFGAKIGRGVRIRPTVRVEIPWNLEIDQDAAVGDYAILYSLGRIRIGRLAVVSQYAHLCAGTHDHLHRAFPLLLRPISIGEEAWVAADAFIGPGVTVGARSVVAARATVVKDIPADQIAAGNPARVVKPRIFKD